MGTSIDTIIDTAETRRDQLRQAVYDLSIGRPLGATADGVAERAKLIWETIDTSQREIRAEATANLVTLSLDQSLPVKLQVEVNNSLIRNAELGYVNRKRWAALNDPHTRAAAIEEFRSPSPELLDVISEAWDGGGRVPDQWLAFFSNLGMIAKEIYDG
jgi:hypothetical protein